MNPLFTVDELARQLQDSGARLLVTVPALLDKASSAARQAGVEAIFVYGEGPGAVPFQALLDPSSGSPVVAIDPAEDPISLPYSSGTTGLPKGVMLTHRNLVAVTQQVIAVNQVGRDDRLIAVLPFYHAYGLCMFLGVALHVGATVVTLPRFELGEFLRLIQQHAITRAFVVPPIVLALAKHPLVSEFDMSSLTFVHCGAAPLSAELERACEQRLSCRIGQGYGMTETSIATHAVPDELTGTMPGSVGLPLPNTECQILDIATVEDLGLELRGEICVRGPQVMKGYFHNPAATADILDDDGWLHTGDLGYVDERGALHVVDRVKELIKYNAYQIAPAELEALLLSHPGVADAAVIGIPDEQAGQVPKAFIVPKGPLSAKEITAFVAQRAAPYKQMRAVTFVDAIPKLPSGKILRRVLHDRERQRAAH